MIIERKIRYYFYGLDLDTKQGHVLFMIERCADGEMLLFSAEELLANEAVLLRLPVACEREAKNEIERQKRRLEWKRANKEMREREEKENQDKKDPEQQEKPIHVVTAQKDFNSEHESPKINS